MTIRLTEFEPVKAASLAMPVEVQDPADGSSVQPSVYQSSDQNLSSRQIVFYLIGILLTATALAKLWMLLTDSFADIRVGIPKEILWLSVAFELWLAWQNFRIRDDRVMALVNTVAFAAFAIFGFIHWLLGYDSCGCSGNLELPAGLFILIDVAIVAWFSATSAQQSQVSDGLREISGSWRGWSPEKRGRLVGLGLFGTLVFVLQLPIAAPLRAKVLGEPPIIATVKIEGALILDEPSIGQVELWNRSSHPARIIGVSRSCRCFDLTEDPVSKIISANGRLMLPLVIKPNKLGPLHQRVELFLDHPKQFRVNVDVLGSLKGVER